MPDDNTIAIDKSASLPAHLDLPDCPKCKLACGTTDDAERGSLRCGACGHEWRATRADLAKAGRADRAYAREREREATDELTLVLMPEQVVETNRRLAREADARRRAADGVAAQQVDLFGGVS